LKAGLLTVAAFSLAVFCPGVAAEVPDSRWTIDMETGALWFSRNRAQIPSDTGTRFDLKGLTGGGPDPYVRVYVGYDFNERHSVRVNLAPVESSGTGILDRAVAFAGEDFIAGDPARASYRFNTYRLTYRWMFHRGEAWDWGVGGTLLVRDAKIELRQGDRRASDDDLGLVPLLHVYGAYRFTDRTALILDLEGAVAPQGRAIDAALKLQHRLPSDWHVYGGYRTLEGGADNSNVYTFAWLHHAVLGIGYSF